MLSTQENRPTSNWKSYGVLHCILILGVYENVTCDKVHKIIKLSKERGIKAGVQGEKKKHTHTSKAD